VLMVDDMVSTAGTVCNSAEVCKAKGAARILLGATHGVLCGPAAERLRNSPIDEIVVTDTIPISQETIDRIGKLRVLSVSSLMGEAIHRIHNNESVSSLFMR
jgi:ribose-phosphate pyrophosphokinase